MKNLLLALCLLPLLATKCARQTPAANDNTPFVQLETGPCFGFCPVYRLTVRNNGWTEYEGKRFTVKTGLDSFQLTAPELARLREKVQRVNLWDYPDHISTQVADAPYGTLTTWADGKTKSVSGTIDRPAPLLELEALVKELALAHGIDVKTGVNPNQPPAAARQSLLVKFKPDVNAGNFMTQISEFDLRLVRRVSADNIWEVSYDPAQIEEKSLIDLLKGLDGVLEAQRNGSTTRPPTPDTPEVIKSKLVALQTHGCRGFCPQYKLTFYTDGLVEYEGIRSVVKMGRDSFRLTAAETKRLQTTVKTANVWQYPDRIENEVADAPMSTLTVFAEGKTKSTMSGVGRPKPLSELERLLQDLAEAHGLQVKEPPAGSGRN